MILNLPITFYCCFMWRNFSANPKKKDDYLWAMKISFLKKDDNDDWKKRRQATSFGGVFGVASELGKKYTYFNEGSMKIMASLVPDEIIYNISDYSKREFDACLMIGDVSG